MNEAESYDLLINQPRRDEARREAERRAEQQLYVEEARKAARAVTGAMSRVLVQRDPPVDWTALIREARDLYGYSLRMIGAAIGVAHSTVQRWEEGSPPNYEDGAAMLRLREKLREMYAVAYHRSRNVG